MRVGWMSDADVVAMAWHMACMHDGGLYVYTHIWSSEPALYPYMVIPMGHARGGGSFITGICG